MTLRVPKFEVVSTMTLRFGSSWRSTKMPVPPMPSRRLSTTCLCSSMKPCRSCIERATREGTVNSENSAIANVSLWSRTAPGALNTFAPWRSASDRSQVLATYSMSNGGSLRMSTASNSRSGRSAVSCARYQSESSGVRERRVALAVTAFFAHRSVVCSQTNTSCPRACAARIIATVVSLYALSSSGGSMTKRMTRLLALRDHEFDARAQLGVGERGVARLGRHGAFALGYRLHERVHPLLDARCPCRLVAELRRSRHARGVADVAHLVVDRFAVRRGSGSRFLARLCLHLLGSGGLGGLLRRGRLLQLAARLVGHEDDGACDLVVGERVVAAARRHGALALERDRQHALQPILEARGPCLRIADLRRARHARLVARATGVLHDGVAGSSAGSRLRLAELHAGHRLDARRHGLGRERIGIRARPVQDELNDQDDPEDRHEEREQDSDDELLRGLDERGMRVVHGHGPGVGFVGNGMILASKLIWVLQAVCRTIRGLERDGFTDSDSILLRLFRR